MASIRVPPRIIYNREDGIRDVFVCQEKLGHGGFAVVYRVIHQNTAKVYAMKVISKNGSTSTRGKLFLDKLKNEIQIQKNIDHPNIVRSRLSFSDDTNYYIILEYCPGKSVRDYLRRSEQRRLSEPETRRILNDVIQGLVYLHNHQIIHHDIKLENFLIGSDGRVKIADFGISSILKDDEEKNYSISGTVNYMSPEIIQKENKGHSYEVDIWALGVSAFIMLTGRPPFDGLDRDIIYRNIRNADYRFPTAINLSYEAKDFIKATLRVDPRKRPTAIDLMTHPFLTKYDKECIILYNPPQKVSMNNLNLNSINSSNSGCLSARSIKDSCLSKGAQVSEEPINSHKYLNAQPSNFNNIINKVQSPTRTGVNAHNLIDSPAKNFNLINNNQFSNENSNSNSNSNTRFNRFTSPSRVSNNIGSYSGRSYREGINYYGSQVTDDPFKLNLNASIPVPNSRDNINSMSPIRTTKNSGSLSARNYKEKGNINGYYGSQVSDDPLSSVKKLNLNANIPVPSPRDNINALSPIRSTKNSGSLSARNYKERTSRNNYYVSQVSDDPPSSIKKLNLNHPFESESNDLHLRLKNVSSPTRSNYRSSSARNYVDNIRSTSSSSSHQRGSSIKTVDDKSSVGLRKNFNLPNHFVAKYCFHKQDQLGYLLSDGTVGVCFDDRSRIVLDPKEGFVQFYNDYNSIADVINLEGSLDLNQEDDEKDLHDKIHKKILLVQKFAKSLKKSQSLFDYPTEDANPSVPLHNVKYFLKNSDSILFRLNDKNIQVNFNDHKKLIIFYNTKKICLVRNLKEKCALIDLKNTANINPNCEELRKYRDAKELLQSLAQKI